MTESDPRFMEGMMSDTGGVELRLTLFTDGTVRIWLNESRPATDVADVLRGIAAGFENNPLRIG